MFLTVVCLLLPPSPQGALRAACAYLRADPEGAGTAWVVDAEKKWLLTSRHVVGDQTRVEIFFPLPKRTLRSEYLADRAKLAGSGHRVFGKVVRTSDEFDLGLVEVPALPEGMRALPLAEALPMPGGPVWSMGHRGDVDTLWNMSAGVLRQHGRIADGFTWQTKPLLKDAPGLVVQLPIAEGDSGGPIVGYSGEVLGMVSAFRNRTPGATFGPSSQAIREFIVLPAPLSPGGKSVGSKLPRSTVWVRPTATDARTAGVLVDAKRRWILTSASGLGADDRVGVAFPILEDDCVKGERDAYRDPVELHLKKLWFPGTVILRDTARDLALIELDGIHAGRPAVPIAADLPETGTAVRAVTHPSGLDFAFVASAGIVKQRGKVSLGRGTDAVPALLLQLPAQGNASGGPLLNPRGELLGVLSGKVAANQQAAYAADTPEVRAFLRDAEAAAFLRLFPRSGEGWLCTRLNLCFALEARKQERWKELLAACDAVLVSEPMNRTALLLRAEALRRTKEPKKAIADLQRLLDVTPGDVPARRAYAEAWAESGDAVRAAKERENAKRVGDFESGSVR